MKKSYKFGRAIEIAKQIAEEKIGFDKLNQGLCVDNVVDSIREELDKIHPWVHWTVLYVTMKEVLVFETDVKSYLYPDRIAWFGVPYNNNSQPSVWKEHKFQHPSGCEGTCISVVGFSKGSAVFLSAYPYELLPNRSTVYDRCTSLSSTNPSEIKEPFRLKFLSYISQICGFKMDPNFGCLYVNNNYTHLLTVYDWY